MAVRAAEPAAAVLSQRRRAEHAAAVLSIHTVTATPRGKGGRKKSSHAVDVRFLPPVRNHTSCCRRETRRCTHVRTLMRMACARACACAPHPSRQSYLALHALYAVGCVHECLRVLLQPCPAAADHTTRHAHQPNPTSPSGGRADGGRLVMHRATKGLQAAAPWCR